MGGAWGEWNAQRFLRSAGATGNCSGIAQSGAATRRAAWSGASLIAVDRAAVALRAVVHPQRVVRLSGFRDGGSRIDRRAGATAELAAGPAAARGGAPPPKRLRGEDRPRIGGSHRAGAFRRRYGRWPEDFCSGLDPRVKLIGIGALIAAAVTVHRLWRIGGNPGAGRGFGAGLAYPDAAAGGARLARGAGVHRSDRAAGDFSDARRGHLAHSLAGMAGDAAGLA